MKLQQARRARLEAQTAGLDLEHLIEQMRAGRTLQQIELEERLRRLRASTMRNRPAAA